MKGILAAALAVGLVTAAPAFANPAELAKTRNCLACHAADKKLVGPSYKDISAKYASQDGAVQMLAGKIQKGGAGVWGPVPMPPNPQVTDAEAKTLAEWVMTH